MKFQIWKTKTFYLFHSVRSQDDPERLVCILEIKETFVEIRLHDCSILDVLFNDSVRWRASVSSSSSFWRLLTPQCFLRLTSRLVGLKEPFQWCTVPAFVLIGAEYRYLRGIQYERPPEAIETFWFNNIIHEHREADDGCQCNFRKLRYGIFTVILQFTALFTCKGCRKTLKEDQSTHICILIIYNNVFLRASNMHMLLLPLPLTS